MKRSTIKIECDSISKLFPFYSKCFTTKFCIFGIPPTKSIRVVDPCIKKEKITVKKTITQHSKSQHNNLVMSKVSLFEGENYDFWYILLKVYTNSRMFGFV